MESISHFIYDYLTSLGLSEKLAVYINMLVLLLFLLVIIFIIDFVIRRLILGAFSQLAKRSKSNFDDIMVKNKVPRNIAHIIPLIIAVEFVPMVFTDFPYWENIIEKALMVFGIVLTLWVVRSLLNTFKDYFKTLPNFKDKPQIAIYKYS